MIIPPCNLEKSYRRRSEKYGRNSTIGYLFLLEAPNHYHWVIVAVSPLDVCSYVLPVKVTYKGATVVHENQPWAIECSDLKQDNLIRWTRNGQSLEPELASGQLTVQSPVGTGSSTLRAMHATDNHDGDYKCTQDSDESFHLWIYFGSYMHTPPFTYCDTCISFTYIYVHILSV